MELMEYCYDFIVKTTSDLTRTEEDHTGMGFLLILI